jgi:S1-C subfamily serine protease
LSAARVVDGPYWKNLFEPGDVIYALNRRPIGDLRDLRTALEGLKAGDAVVVQLEREGRMLYVPFQIE